MPWTYTASSEYEFARNRYKQSLNARLLNAKTEAEYQTIENELSDFEQYSQNVHRFSEDPATCMKPVAKRFKAPDHYYWGENKFHLLARRDVPAQTVTLAIFYHGSDYRTAFEDYIGAL
jgi:hypothetical protein